MSIQEEKNYDKPFDIRIFKSLLPFVKPYWRTLLWLLLVALVSAGLDLVIPLFMRDAINDFIVPGTLEELLPYSLRYFAAIAAQVVSVVLFARFAMRAEMWMGRDMKRALFVHLQELSFSYYNATPVGYSHSRVMSDTNHIAGRIAWGLLDGVWSLAYAAGMIFVMLKLNWRMTLWVLPVIPVVSLIAFLSRKKMLNTNRDVRKANSQITRSYNESIGGARTSKVLVIEDSNYREFRGFTQDYYRAGIRASRMQAVFISVIALCGAVTEALVIARGGQMNIAAGLDVGTLTTFVTYTTGLLGPIQNIARQVTETIAMQANVERVADLLQLTPDVTDTPQVMEQYGDSFAPKKENWEALHGDVEFRDVTFRYPDGEENVLEHFNLTVPAGTTVAIVGETGAGKSTIVNLACRFFEPTAGEILVDGRDYRERSQLWLHSNLGYVLQNPHLFSGSIRENIRYGRLDATDEEVEAAAALVMADKGALRLENGYETDVGEGGDLLSTGEKQLVSYARAVLANPPLFVLDEATSSIDTETERLIQQATEQLLQGRTSFIIAHRLSTIKMADIILVVKDGKVTERGSHRELLQAKGAYYELYTRQYEDLAWQGHAAK